MELFARSWIPTTRRTCAEAARSTTAAFSLNRDVARAPNATLAPPLLYSRHANQHALPPDCPFPPAMGFCVAATAADLLAARRGPPHPVPRGAAVRTGRAVAAPERAAARPAAC